MLIRPGMPWPLQICGCLIFRRGYAHISRSVRSTAFPARVAVHLRGLVVPMHVGSSTPPGLEPEGGLLSKAPRWPRRPPCGPARHPGSLELPSHCQCDLDRPSDSARGSSGVSWKTSPPAPPVALALRLRATGTSGAGRRAAITGQPTGSSPSRPARPSNFKPREAGPTSGCQCDGPLPNRGVVHGVTSLALSIYKSSLSALQCSVEQLLHITPEWRSDGDNSSVHSTASALADGLLQPYEHTAPAEHSKARQPALRLRRDGRHICAGTG